MASNWGDLWVYRFTLKREVIITLPIRGLWETHLGPLRENLHHWFVINWMTNNKIRQTLLGNTAHMLLLITVLISFSKPQWGWPWLSWMTNCVALLYVSPRFLSSSHFSFTFLQGEIKIKALLKFFTAVSLVLHTKAFGNERRWRSACAVKSCYILSSTQKNRNVKLLWIFIKTHVRPRILPRTLSQLF